MSDTFAGLTRRINEFVHDRETSEELSHLLDEAKEQGGDAADALIELALSESHDDDDDCYEGDDEGLDVAIEDDEMIDDVDGDGDIDEADIDSALADLEGDDDDDDEDLIDESAELRAGEILVI